MRVFGLIQPRRAAGADSRCADARCGISVDADAAEMVGYLLKMSLHDLVVVLAL